MGGSFFFVQYGSEHKKTKDSSQYLNDLTGKAVSVQKSVSKWSFFFFFFFFLLTNDESGSDSCFVKLYYLSFFFQITEMSGKSGGGGKLWGELLGSRGEMDMANGGIDKPKSKTQLVLTGD